MVLRVILNKGEAQPHTLSTDFARKGSRIMAARSHLGAARNRRLFIAWRTARHEASAPNSHRFKPRGYGRRSSRTLTGFRNNWRKNGEKTRGGKTEIQVGIGATEGRGRKRQSGQIKLGREGKKRTGISETIERSQSKVGVCGDEDGIRKKSF